MYATRTYANGSAVSLSRVSRDQYSESFGYYLSLIVKKTLFFYIASSSEFGRPCLCKFVVGVHSVVPNFIYKMEDNVVFLACRICSILAISKHFTVLEKLHK